MRTQCIPVPYPAGCVIFIPSDSNNFADSYWNSDTQQIVGLRSSEVQTVGLEIP